MPVLFAIFDNARGACSEMLILDENCDTMIDNSSRHVIYIRYTGTGKLTQNWTFLKSDWQQK